MDLSKFFYLNHLKLFIIVGFLLFFKTSVFAQSYSDVLQQANDLLLKAARTHDENLTHQAKDKFSTWLQNNKDHSNKKLVAKALRSRADAYMMLNEKSNAISDYQESIQYDPVAPLQLLICHFKQEQSDSSNLHTCYAKAVDIFSKQKTPVENSSFLIARILSGDKSAITEYRNILPTLKGVEKDSYKLEAETYLNDATYKEIIKE